MSPNTGIGPITAFALTTYAADMSHFRNGREFAAWIGITPQSTARAAGTGAITKMGQRDLRALLVQGAMAVALANKMARTA